MAGKKFFAIEFFQTSTHALRVLLKSFALIAIVTLALDQFTKNVATQNFLIYEEPLRTDLYQGKREEVFSGEILGLATSLQLTYVRNHGASFGVFRNLSQSLRLPTLVVVGVLFIGALFMAAWASFVAGRKLLSYSLILIITGAAGNLIDRIRLGYVIDFISLKIGFGSIHYSFPVFNVADLVVLVGVLGSGLALFGTSSKK